ncbi:LysR substrate-binding domain-containing protein [Eubacterium pyruvativorans]|uniref:LysR substrate-binding domain-containing protein n=1 Tax=Eubacterium pyruvativorans TaxID=155865 RepID=UPI0015695980|nr:LysR substrate-binding domain-containing protein [Eubacterium pyruvativorans]
MRIRKAHVLQHRLCEKLPHRLLQEDCGISFLYRTIVEEDLRSGLLREIPLRDFHIRHDYTFLWRKDSIFSDEIRRICLELRSPGE